MRKDPIDEKNSLLRLNKFIQRETGVFIRQEDEGIAYSDGDTEELYIQQAISSVDDVSSLSEELRSFERDWASECHLSSQRANVFRALDFSGVQHVLEIGSGCGAITRFLGEQGGNVDAVEGSLRRAEITRLRCRDLENVLVINADFNTLHLPEQHYDLILFTGVLEYAGKFCDDGDLPEDAAVTMLARCMNCLAPGGALVVAIENRIGFKYLAGACEDHFSRPWVGLSQYPDCNDSNYREKQGIRTWDKGQWRQMIEQLDGVISQWYYPFPDYKLATSLLSEDFIQNDPAAWSCLSRVHSRDYTAIWHSPFDEQLFWQTAAAAGFIEEMSNSFVLILQRDCEDEEKIDLLPFDFVHFSGHDRKLKYRVKVQKDKGKQIVSTTSLVQQAAQDPGAAVTQHLEDEPYFDGTLLAVHWCNVLRSCTSPKTFDVILNEYYQYVVRECEPDRAGMLLDLLPFNIVIGEEGHWSSFDQEWRTEQEITPQFIFFRALLYFYLENKAVLRLFCTQQSLNTGWEFVKYCLGRVLYSSEFDLQSFVEVENNIQQEVSRPEAVASVESMLDTLPDLVLNDWSWKQSSLIWGDTGRVSVPVSSSLKGQARHILFSLPPEACFSPYLQLSLGIPEHEIGSTFTLRSFTLYGHQVSGTREVIFPLKERGVSLPPLMKLTGVTYFPDVMGGVFSVDDREPQVLHFLFPEHRNKEYTALDCEIVIEFLGKSSAEIRLDQAVREKQQLDVLQENKRQQIAHLHKSLAGVEQYLAEIEQSRAWQTVLKLRKAQERLSRLFGKHAVTESKEFHEDIGQELKEGTVGVDEKLTSHGKREENELVTVILGVYNTGADELRQTVDSVLSQTYPNWELVIVDSSSTDGVTLQALADLEHPRIKIHYLKHSHSLTQAMDEGISLANGNWVTFLGHFDRLYPDALRSFLQDESFVQADVVYCDEDIIGRYGDILSVKTKPAYTCDALVRSDNIGSTLFIRHSLVEQVGGLDAEFDGVQLFDLVLRAAKYTDKIVHLEKVLYKTRQFEPPVESEQERITTLSNLSSMTHLS